ncbi:MAG: glycerophosphodiester phosphodiesterase family protein [Candidatus Izemoplasma sp.]|nr:glycerophosphodiester phosphodiesterase family protein [Candidatus Izemoplasma sp.]
MTKDMTWIKTGYFAHRGLYNDKDIPENSMAAFEEAIAHGYDIECDVRLTKDNRLVVFHDASLFRMTGKKAHVRTQTLSDIKRLTLLDTSERVRTLRDVLTSLPQDTSYLIELKPYRSARRLVNVFLKEIEGLKIRYAVHSFDPFVIYQFKKKVPNIIRGQIAETFPGKRGLMYFLLKHMAFNCISKPDFINYRFEDLPRKRLDRLKQKGIPILSFSARSEEDLTFVRNHYDNAVFEHFKPKKEYNE